MQCPEEQRHWNDYIGAMDAFCDSVDAFAASSLATFDIHATAVKAAKLRIILARSEWELHVREHCCFVDGGFR